MEMCGEENRIDKNSLLLKGEVEPDWRTHEKGAAPGMQGRCVMTRRQKTTKLRKKKSPTSLEKGLRLRPAITSKKGPLGEKEWTSLSEFPV